MSFNEQSFLKNQKIKKENKSEAFADRLKALGTVAIVLGVTAATLSALCDEAERSMQKAMQERTQDQDDFIVQYPDTSSEINRSEKKAEDELIEKTRKEIGLHIDFDNQEMVDFHNKK